MTELDKKEREFKASRLATKLEYYQAVVDFLSVFAETEIGSDYEINRFAVSEYLCSGKFIIDSQIQAFDRDSILKIMEEDVLNGMRIWDYFILSDWTRNMLEKSYEIEVKQVIKEMREQYKCTTCKYFEVNETDFGNFYDCGKEICMNGSKYRRRKLFRGVRYDEVFDLQEECDYYEYKKKEEKS